MAEMGKDKDLWHWKMVENFSRAEERYEGILQNTAKEGQTEVRKKITTAVVMMVMQVMQVVMLVVMVVVMVMQEMLVVMVVMVIMKVMMVVMQ